MTATEEITAWPIHRIDIIGHTLVIHDMVTGGPEAGAKGKGRVLHLSDIAGCNYLSLSLIRDFTSQVLSERR